MAELEKWRPDIEARYKQRNEEVDKRLEKQHDALEIHKGHFRDQQSVCAVHHNQADNRYDEFKEVTKAAQADRDDLAERAERTDIRISDSIEHIQEQIDTNY